MLMSSILTSPCIAGDPCRRVISLFQFHDVFIAEHKYHEMLVQILCLAYS